MALYPAILAIHWPTGVSLCPEPCGSTGSKALRRAQNWCRLQSLFGAIDTGLHLGYRKGLTGGRWVIRRYLGGEKYAVETIAAADDHSPADGINILDFFQAQRKARVAGAPVAARAFTVAAALDAYFERLGREGSKSLANAIGRTRLHILPALGAMPVASLTRETLSKWLAKLPGKAADGHSGEDAIRAHRASANRVLIILRAALNQAFRDGKIASDAAWRAVTPFRGVDAPRLRYFTQEEVRRLINAAQGPFRELVKAALFTGCRYGELTRLRAGDFNRDSGTLFVGQSKSGKARHVVLTSEGRRFFETLTAGRAGDATMLTHADGGAWKASHQTRPMAEACTAARIEPAAGFHTLRHTAASHLVMSGVPLNVVAHNLGHANTVMTEKHYAHLAPSYLAETIRRFAPEFGIGEETAIVRLPR
jgi:integrase